MKRIVLASLIIIQPNSFVYKPIEYHKVWVKQPTVQTTNTFGSPGTHIYEYHKWLAEKVEEPVQKKGIRIH